MGIILVTGASSGIGAEFSRLCFLRGYDVTLVARRGDRLMELATEASSLGRRALVCDGDVRDASFLESTVERTIEELGGLDVAVANAGMGIFGRFAEMDAADIDRMVSVNLTGTLNLARSALPRLLQQNHGTFAAVASIAGLMGYADMSVYCATKFALVGFMEGLWGELRGTGVRTTLLCPGEVETEFFTSADRNRMPAASRLIPPLRPERVARALLRGIEKKRRMVVMPPAAALYMRFHRLFPGISLRLFYAVSRVMNRG